MRPLRLSTIGMISASHANWRTVETGSGLSVGELAHRVGVQPVDERVVIDRTRRAPRPVHRPRRRRRRRSRLRPATGPTPARRCQTCGGVGGGLGRSRAHNLASRTGSSEIRVWRIPDSRSVQRLTFDIARCLSNSSASDLPAATELRCRARSRQLRSNRSTPDRSASANNSAPRATNSALVDSSRLRIAPAMAST